MGEMIFYALTSALTCIPYSYSVHYSLTPKKKDAEKSAFVQSADMRYALDKALFRRAV